MDCRYDFGGADYPLYGNKLYALMNLIDWVVLCFTLLAIVAYGTWRTRKQRDLNSYLRGGQEAGWATVGLSVMATQASAITFLSTPGQAFESGMGFIQFYFGLPIALILVSIVIVPLFYRLNVYTAYEFLENRFDLNTRLLTAFLFLVQRGLAAGITIYAPAIVLSTVLGWNLTQLNVIIGVLVIIYTVSGGTKAVSVTQKWQMAVIMGGMIFAFVLIMQYINENFSFMEAVKFAGANGKMQIVDLVPSFESRYTIWSGITGGLFLALSYFGTDQSQVQRYISASSVRQSRMGLMFNAILKIPMQFFILFTGVMLFVFYQGKEQPISFNQEVVEVVMNSDRKEEGAALLAEFKSIQQEKNSAIANTGLSMQKDIERLLADEARVKNSFNKISESINDEVPTKDSDYVFIRFILDYLPHGAIGLLLAVILSAAMSSTAGELNALATTTMNDFFTRLSKNELSDKQQVLYSKLITVGWGLLAISFALMANLFDNLIELVNILGSLFYGTILGIFVCAIFLKTVLARDVIIGAAIAEATVLFLFAGSHWGFLPINIGFLWFNVIGCGIVVIVALMVSKGGDGMDLA
ncbi:MAG: sodium:solute symporter [Salibacteraceae bacterium]